MKKYLLICFALISLSACSKNNTSVPNNQNTGRVDLEKSAYLLKEDNWVYELMIHYPNKTEQVVDAYAFDVTNVHYKEMDGFSEITSVDAQGQRILQGKSSMPAYSNHPDYAKKTE